MHIACVTTPRFAVEAERQRRPEVAARLILIGAATVIDCSLGASASGVRRGMRMSEAIALCPKAVVLAPDRPYYERRYAEVVAFLDLQSPGVEPAEPGTAFLDLAGLEFAADELIAALHQRCGFMASVGIGGGKFVARLAAEDAPPGSAKTVPAATEAAFLAPLPSTMLPASEAMLWRLKMLGIDTIGQVAKLPVGAFQQQFGLEGKRCWELANGNDNEPLVPHAAEEVITRRVQLPAPTASLETIFAGFERLVHAAYNDRAREGHWVRKVIVRAVQDGGGAWELPVAFREAMCDPKASWFAVKSAIARHPPERPVEELEIELVGLSGESGKQAGMFESKGKLLRQVEEAARHLTVNGKQTVGRIVEVEPWSRIPERRAALQDFVP